MELSEIERILEDKYQAIKHARGWGEEEDNYAIFTSQSNKKSPRKHLRDVVGTVASLDTKQLIVPIRKTIRIKVKELKMTTRKNRVLKETLQEKDIEICQNLIALFVVKMNILPKIS